MKITRQIEILLSRPESETIRDFWSSKGKTGEAMLAQPKLRDGSYWLKIRICTFKQCDKIEEILK